MCKRYNAINVWPTFLSTFNALGMTTLRYPSGTVTEADFDFKDSNGPLDDSISLTMFLQAVQTHDITPLLVVPTKRFRSNYTTTGAQYVKDFVKAVNIDHGRRRAIRHHAEGADLGARQRILWR